MLSCGRLTHAPAAHRSRIFPLFRQTPLGDRIYGVKLKCGPRYPDVAPQLAFVQKIAGLPGVNANGVVDYKQVTGGREWTRNTTMYDYLCRVREAMVAA